MPRWITDDEREHFRAELAPIVARVAREMYAEYLRDMKYADAPLSAAEAGVQRHWERTAWIAVTGSIDNPHWPWERWGRERQRETA